jgi:cytochrome b6-f complex iron-sulfur subunit
MKSLTRHAFLALSTRALLAAGGLLSAAGLWRFLSFAPQAANPTKFDLGLASDFPLGSTTFFDPANAIISHTADGFQALSTICPHLGCEVSSVGAEYHCPCHGSRFDGQGDLLQGPASQPLRRLQIEQSEDGRLTLHTQTNLIVSVP